MLKQNNLFDCKTAFDQQFSQPIIGVDEAGRGPLAGAVVAAAVQVPPKVQLLGLRDSKKLSISKRQELYETIINSCPYGIGIASVAEIDELNILQASLLAMRRAITICREKTDYKTILIDGNCSPLPDNKNVITVIKGDDKSAAIAAASVIAKVTRDAMMLELHNQFPQYLWHKNAGYPTKLHKQAIAMHGLTEHHRRSFKYY